MMSMPKPAQRVLRISFYCLCSGIFLSLPAQSQHSVSYRQFVKHRELYDSGVALVDRNHFKSALELFRITITDPDTKLSSHNYAAICYVKLGNGKKALEEIEEAFRHGYLLQFLKHDKPLQPIWTDIEKRYRALRPGYLAGIDTALRHELSTLIAKAQQVRRVLTDGNADKNSVDRVVSITDSSNIARLRQIEQKHGWPGFKLIGNRQTMSDSLDFEVNTLLLHADERENIYFLRSALAKIEAGEASWWDAYGIMKNLVFRFSQDGFHKLRNTYFYADGKLDEERSFFQLKVLSDFMKDNPLQRITLFPVQHPGKPPGSRQQEQKSLRAVREFLIRQGISPKAVSVREKIKAVEDDGLGSYSIGYIRE